MTLAVLLPTVPTYDLGAVAFPLVHAPLGVFSLTVLSNTVLVGLAYPLALALRNARAGEIRPAMFLARRLPADALPTAHGRLFETRRGITRSGLDLDALRMYLRWRGATLADLRADPTGHRDPASVGETHDPTDGAVHAAPATDGGVGPAEPGAIGSDGSDGRDVEDPWAAAAFLSSVEGSAYGTTPDSLREGLEAVTAQDDVWVSPGLPFVVPMFVGLLCAFTFGDLLFWSLTAIGVV